MPHHVAPVLIWVIHVDRLEHGGGLYHLADGPPAPRLAVPPVDACDQRMMHLDKDGPSLELPASARRHDGHPDRAPMLLPNLLPPQHGAASGM